MQFTGQKAEQPASTACLLARKCNRLARKMAANMRNAICVRTIDMLCGADTNFKGSDSRYPSGLIVILCLCALFFVMQCVNSVIKVM